MCKLLLLQCFIQILYNYLYFYDKNNIVVTLYSRLDLKSGTKYKIKAHMYICESSWVLTFITPLRTSSKYVRKLLKQVSSCPLFEYQKSNLVDRNPFPHSAWLFFGRNFIVAVTVMMSVFVALVANFKMHSNTAKTCPWVYMYVWVRLGGVATAGNVSHKE